ncbi:ABC transporter ATP-binding protein [Rhodovarius crocodyli]|uniref:Spermidine/putrescine import ATP-binding protein PotA n=1 Tax=Rhodovarius crocodyli TaxID=1979269 RepID=A0A437MFB4_9PROT|nr:ABC transporter ATP-binding protein [Rhodovarius crocodyli]RVT96320.1 ABC transporter ATP-binding protein [Rhodovarius crocodyli]
MAKPVDLALSGLSKHYGRNVAVEGVTLRIAAGELVALLGPSGCGKTTTLRMVAGLVEPSAGEILIGGMQVTKVPVHKRNIGMLFQNYALFPHLSIAQNVAFGLQMRGVGKAETAKRVADALALVQLGSFADRLPAALSGGQQQRVALARALVIEPSLLLLDEPLGALDKNLRESMQVELRQIQRRLGITAVLVTHDQEEAMTLADRIVIMRDGKLEQVGTPEEIYSQPATRFVAGFIGAANFLKGTVASRGAEGLAIALPGGGRLLLPTETQEAPLVAVRPEAIAIGPADGPLPGNGTPATVEQVVYRGQMTHLYMRLDDGEPLLAYLANRDGAAPDGAGMRVGERVMAHWPASANKVVRDN